MTAGLSRSNNNNTWQLQPGPSNRTFSVISPVYVNEVCSVHEALGEDVGLAVEPAQKAFDRWGSLSAVERDASMFGLVQLIQRDAEEIAHLDDLYGKASIPMDLRYFGVDTFTRPVELLKKMDIPGLAGVFNYFAVVLITFWGSRA